jgi:hypothetical protein
VETPVQTRRQRGSGLLVTGVQATRAPARPGPASACGAVGRRGWMRARRAPLPFHDCLERMRGLLNKKSECLFTRQRRSERLESRGNSAEAVPGRGVVCPPDGRTR